MDDSADPPDILPERDYGRYEGYWHGITFIIFDSEQPGDQWIRSTVWVTPPDAEDAESPE